MIALATPLPGVLNDLVAGYLCYKHMIPIDESVDGLAQHGLIGIAQLINIGPALELLTADECQDVLDAWHKLKSHGMLGWSEHI